MSKHRVLLLKVATFQKGALYKRSAVSCPTKLAQPVTYDTGTYVVGYNPNNHHGGGASFPDHTTGTGKMLIVNASQNANTTIWQQTVTVTPHTDYRLTSWGASWGNDSGFDPNPAQLRFSINSVPLGADFLLPSQDGTWSEFSGVWNSGSANIAVIQVVDINTQYTGNDFVLDDMAFSPVVVSRTVGGIIALQGTQNTTQPVEFTFRPTTGTPFTRTAALNINEGFGSYSFPDIPVGNYTVSIKGTKWLQKNISVNASTGNVTNANATLLAGDANNDNVADVSDLLLMINHYNQQKNIPANNSNYLEAADFNCDDVNDVADLLLIIGNYNKQGDS